MKNRPLTQKTIDNRILMILNGNIMVNNNGKHVEAFHLFGSQYSTNTNRQVEYSMDDYGWKPKLRPEYTSLFLQKIVAIISGRVHKLKRRKDV